MQIVQQNKSIIFLSARLNYVFFLLARYSPCKHGSTLTHSSVVVPKIHFALR